MDLPFLLKVEDKVINNHAVAAEVDTPEASVTVDGVEGLVAMHAGFLSHHGRQPAGQVRATTVRAVVVANHRVGDHQRDVVLVSVTDSLDSNRHVAQRHVVIAVADLAAGEAGGGHVTHLPHAWCQLPEVLLSQLAQSVVVNTTGSGQDHAGSMVVGVDVLHKVLTLEGPGGDLEAVRG